MAFLGSDTSLLANLRVLDLADEKASFCSKLLAGMGAEVVKVESPGGDSSRTIGPFWENTPNPNKSLSFWYNNTDKLGITLNLETERGKDIFLRLAGKADVVVETFPPGYLKELSLDYKTLTEINPGIILASITGFGQTGPYSKYKSCDIVASALGGQMFVCGTPDASPVRLFGQQSYYVASLFAAVGILMALRNRHHNGKGQHIDISLQEAVAATLDHVMVRYFYDNVIPRRQGNFHWNNSACILPGKDGYILITFNREWNTLIDWLDSEGMAENLKEQRWYEQEYRMQHVDRVIEVLTNWTMTHTVAELFEKGQLMHFPWAPVNSLGELFDNPQLKARNFFTLVDHPELDASFSYPDTPCKFSGFARSQVRRAPLIGEHNTCVYHDELGISFDELSELSSADII